MPKSDIKYWKGIKKRNRAKRLTPKQRAANRRRLEKAVDKVFEARRRAIASEGFRRHE